MKTLSIIAVALLMTTSLRAQDTPPRKVHPAIRTAHRSPAFVLQKKPSVQEIANLFVRTEAGEIDPFELIGMLAAKKDTVVPALAELLFSPGIKGKKDRPAKIDTLQIIDAAAPNGIYAILALQAIGSSTAYAALFKAAATEREDEVRGMALHALAEEYYHKVQEEQVTPNKELVHLMARCVRDTQEVAFLKTTIGTIARGGMKNWLGEHHEGKIGMEDEKWWIQNKDKVKWNKKKGQFELSTR